MHHADRVRRGEGVADLGRDLHGPVYGKRPLGELSRQVTALDQVHDKVAAVVVDAETADADDVPVAQPGQGVGFPAEARDHPGVGPAVARQHFDRHRLVQPQVACPPYGGRAAAAQFLFELVTAVYHTAQHPTVLPLSR